MTKKILPLVLTLLLLCGCGAKEETPYTLADAEALLNSAAFEGSDMARLDSDVLVMLYGIDEAAVTECVGYMAANTSVSADELAVFILTDEEAAAAVEEACQSRVASQITMSQSYCPDAVPRLEKALISRVGNTVLLAVGDSAVITETLKK